MIVELEAGLNPTSDPTSQFVTQEEKRGTGMYGRSSAVRERSLSQHWRQCPRGWVIGLRVIRHPSHALAKSFIIMSIFGE